MFGLMLLSGVAAPGSPLRAQGFRVALNGGGTLVRLQRTVGLRTDELTGVAASGEGRLSLWRIELGAEYLEGQLEPRGSSAASPRDLVEGSVVLGVRPVPWLVFKGGPHARGYVQGGVTERWVSWEAGVRADVAMAAPAVRGHLEVWHALSGDVTNAPGPFGGSQGGEVGMTLRFSRAPLWLRLSYGFERARLASAAGLDMVESLTMVIGVGAGR